VDIAGEMVVPTESDFYLQKRPIFGSPSPCSSPSGESSDPPFNGVSAKKRESRPSTYGPGILVVVTGKFGVAERAHPIA
jgi:hypothetical protein